MRPIPDALRERFLSSLQTAANNADPKLTAIISRSAFPVTSGEDISRALITEADGLSACSVAVRRPVAGREPDRVYAAWLDESGSHVKYSAISAKMSDFVWIEGGFAEDADDIALAFDGTMPKAADGTAQLVTAERPWVFWIKDGVLKGRILGLLGDVTLASANAGRVSAIRATWSPHASANFGLVVFFTLSGALYYRQLMDGVWYDAEPVTFGPSGVTWTDVAAFRTWDYRVGVQALGSDGKVYEIFTQFQGIGKHGAENISFDAAAAGSLKEIQLGAAREREHISLGVASTAPYGGLYQTGEPQIVEAANLVNGSGNWGKAAAFRFDRHLNAAEVAAQPTAFHIIDALDRHFVAQTASLADDGLTVRLTFLDFNGANGVCQAAYIPGTVHSMASVALTATACAFTPTGLVPPSVPAPTASSVGNTGNTVITVRFTAPLIGSISGAASHFAAKLQIPDWSPGGTLAEQSRAPASVAMSDSDTLTLTFAAGNLSDLGNAVENIVLEYDGAGPLQGEGGPVFPFAESFAPSGLTPKYDSNDAEHIGLSVAASGVLTAITRRDTYENEHIGLSVAASGVLTHVSDL